MKTERRHELQTNVLADWLGHKTEAIRPYFKLIVGGIGAIFIVAILATVISNQQMERASRGWADYFAAASGDSPDRLRTVAEEHAGTLPAIWATQREADLELARGIRALYSSRGEATEALAAAKKLYQVVETGATGQPVLKQVAQFGIAQAYEAEGDVEKANDYYQKVIATAKGSSVGKEAQARLDLLKDQEAQEFLAWFQRQTPTPRGPDGGFPGGFPQGPDDNMPRSLSEIPGRPDLSIPTPQVNPRAESSFPTAEPGTSTPAATDPAPTDPAPTDPAPTDPAPTDPAPTDPAPTDPAGAPTDPAPKPTDPAPAPTDPPTTDPAPKPADPAPTDPAPAPTDPAPKPTEAAPAPTDPAPTDPAPASPAPEAPAPATPAEAPAGAAATSE